MKRHPLDNIEGKPVNPNHPIFHPKINFFTDIISAIAAYFFAGVIWLMVKIDKRKRGIH